MNWQRMMLTVNALSDYCCPAKCRFGLAFMSKRVSLFATDRPTRVKMTMTVTKATMTKMTMTMVLLMDVNSSDTDLICWFL